MIRIEEQHERPLRRHRRRWSERGFNPGGRHRTRWGADGAAVDRIDPLDPLWLVFEQLEIVGAQAGDELTLTVGDDGVYFDDDCRRAEGLLAGGLG